jgi:hypothetical protein
LETVSLQAVSSFLYGEELVVVLADEKRRATKTWREHVYTREENSVRHGIQQRYWRRGRGKATEADARAEQQADFLSQLEADT